MGMGMLFKGYRVSDLQDEESPGDCLHNNVGVNVLNSSLKND